MGRPRVSQDSRRHPTVAPDPDLKVEEPADLLGALVVNADGLDGMIAERVQDIVDLSFGVIEDTLLHGTPEQQQGLVAKLAPFMFKRGEAAGAEDAEKAKGEVRKMISEMWDVHPDVD